MSTDKSTIASYNKNARFWSEQLKSGNNFGHAFLEKPAMKSKLPDLKNKKVLCIGCGSGEECYELKRLGADEIIGIDISRGLVDMAKRNFPDIEFRVMDMEDLQFPDESFDFGYSSLTLHYVKDWKPTLKSIYRVLKPHCKFLFSVHHPVKWSAQYTEEKDNKKFMLGYMKNNDSTGFEVFGDYLNPIKHQTTLLSKINITYFNKSISGAMRDILDSGFTLNDFLEPKPLEEVKDVNNQFYQIHQKIPLFMIFEILKK